MLEEIKDTQELNSELVTNITIMVERQCSGLTDFVEDNMFTVISVASILYAFLLLDQTLDRGAVEAAVGLFVACLCMPLVYLLIRRICRYRSQESSVSAGAENSLANDDVNGLRASSKSGLAAPEQETVEVVELTETINALRAVWFEEAFSSRYA